MIKTYYAHRSRDGRLQTIVEHADGTARRAAEFAYVFRCKNLTNIAGRYHDIGKYGEKFQLRLFGSKESYEHSSYGMKLLSDYADKTTNPEQKYAAMLLAYIISGHHTGLPDFGSRASTENDSSFNGKLRRIENKPNDCVAYRDELGELPEIPPLDDKFVPNGGKDKMEGWYRYQFLGRMLFSALVDADYLDTEEFMSGGAVQRDSGETFSVLAERFDKYMSKFADKTGKLNEERQKILKSCIDAAEGERGIYKLTVPTGGGKTLSSMAFALRHLVKHGMSRIIYVIPYVSIIRQTVQEFEEIFGKDNVLGHYATADFWENPHEDEEMPTNEELASENWDKPIIVTTNVQFFESLYSNKTSRCRKIHNIADSVIIFDEAQMLPVGLLKPCIRAVSELAENYGCTSVLCTATQPMLDGLFGDNTVLHEICPDTTEMYADLKRVRYEWLGKLSDNGILSRLKETNAALCVLNRKRTTREYYKALHTSGEDDGIYHLSTYMTPRHIAETIETIKARLEAIREGRINGRCLVFSTSLIEAGVDIDFPTVYREIAGLDSIIQAGGRCNREGRNSIDDSAVYVFEREELPLVIDEKCGWVKQHFDFGHDISSPRAITSYFNSLYGWHAREQYDRLDENRILPIIENTEGGGEYVQYRKIAERFRYIDDRDQKLILVPNEQNLTLCEELRNGRISRKLLRMLSKDMVSLKTREYTELQNKGVLTPTNGGIAILEKGYDPECGIMFDGDVE